MESSFPRFQRYLPGALTPVGVMHVVDRVCGGQFLLGTEEKEYFSRLLHKLLPFCGLELLTWTCLDNHYHLLLRVPNGEEAQRLRAGVSEEELFARMGEGSGGRGAFSAQYIQEVRWRVEAYRGNGQEEMAESILRRLREQMYDVSAFMHMLKRRFSAWYNKENGRKGTLWEGRFRSVLVEDCDEAILQMSAYIDLNAVRAGLVKDPKDYRWCGYAEALAGRSVAREGITEVVRASVRDDSVSWSEACQVYRGWVRAIEGGAQDSRADGASSSSETAGRGQLLRCRVRYFSDGLAIGSQGFVESIFGRYRHTFGSKRESGARRMRHGEWGGLCSLRDLRKDAVTVPKPPD